MLHSCGYQMQFLEKYVEAGIDILQSLQIGAGNDLEKAYDITNGNLAFATGIDVQLTARWSPAEIQTSIREAYQTGIRAGKFILGMSHMLQHDLPEESMRAIFTAVRACQNRNL